MTDYMRDPNGLNASTDDDLPGMWSESDFMGGDPDERSYAERGWQHNTFAARLNREYDDTFLQDALRDAAADAVSLWRDPAPLTPEALQERINEMDALGLLPPRRFILGVHGEHGDPGPPVGYDGFGAPLYDHQISPEGQE